MILQSGTVWGLYELGERSSFQPAGEDVVVPLFCFVLCSKWTAPQKELSSIFIIVSPIIYHLIFISFVYYLWIWDWNPALSKREMLPLLTQIDSAGINNSSAKLWDPGEAAHTHTQGAFKPSVLGCSNLDLAPCWHPVLPHWTIWSCSVSASWTGKMSIPFPNHESQDLNIRWWITTEKINY